MQSGVNRFVVILKCGQKARLDLFSLARDISYITIGLVRLFTNLSYHSPTLRSTAAFNTRIANTEINGKSPPQRPLQNLVSSPFPSTPRSSLTPPPKPRLPAQIPLPTMLHPHMLPPLHHPTQKMGTMQRNPRPRPISQAGRISHPRRNRPRL